MAYQIVFRDNLVEVDRNNVSAEAMANTFLKVFARMFIEDSRFTIKDIKNVSMRAAKTPKGVTKRRRQRITLHQIRLKESKPYCGNHAGPCVEKNPEGKPDVKRKYLEGADWVAFNDMVNYALDVCAFPAEVDSIDCNMRHGKMRRISYFMDPDSPERDRDFYREGFSSEYEDWTNPLERSEWPHSEYEDGTPGNPEWRTHNETETEKEDCPTGACAS